MFQLQPKGLHPGFIAAIVLACVLLITIIIVVVLWKFKVQPNTKTYGESVMDDAAHSCLRTEAIHTYAHVPAHTHWHGGAMECLLSAWTDSCAVMCSVLYQHYNGMQ